MITTFIFDIGNVLLDFNYLRQYRAIFPEETALALADATLGRPELWIEMDRGVLTYEEAVDGLVQNSPHLAREIPRAVDYMYRHVEAFSYAAPWLKALKERGYRIYILSNYGQTPLLLSRERMDFLKYADGALYSYEIRDTKPSPAIYRVLCEKFHISPEEAVFLDDSVANVAGAKAFGLHTVHFTGYADALRALEQLPLAYGL